MARGWPFDIMRGAGFVAAHCISLSSSLSNPVVLQLPELGFGQAPDGVSIGAAVLDEPVDWCAVGAALRRRSVGWMLVEHSRSLAALDLRVRQVERVAVLRAPHAAVAVAVVPECDVEGAGGHQ